MAETFDCLFKGGTLVNQDGRIAADIGVKQGRIVAIGSLDPARAGEVIDCTIECWLHGSAFDLRTGIPLSPPAVAPVAVYDVRLDDDADPMILISTTPRDPRSPNSTDEGALR